jgi:hypothetical protein
MKILALAALSAVAFAGCTDLKEMPTAPEVVGLEATPVVAMSLAPQVHTYSTVCMAYESDLALTRVEMAMNVTDAAASSRIEALNIMIADACN